MSYKTEMHVHSKNVSRCSSNTPEQIANAYKEAGYTTIVSTNHYSIDSFAPYPDMTIRERAEYFIKGYREVKEACEAVGITALFGLELRFHVNYNDYLIYGFSEELLLESGDLLQMNAASFKELANANGALIIQAHPFRFGMTISHPDHINGIERFNALGANNEISEAWADKFNFITTSGTDFHHATTVIKGGIVTDEPIRTNAQLVEILQSGKYNILKG